MKKTIMFLGVLSLGLAHAQQYDGKVGVNTDTPNATLNVKSKTGTTEATKNFELQNAANTKLVTVLDNGNVGVNIDAPKGKLHVYGTSIFQPEIPTDAVWVLSNSSIHGASGLIHTQIRPDRATSTNAGFKEYTTGTGRTENAEYRLGFLPELNNVNNYTSLLVVKGATGNVGIGLSNASVPTHKLHIGAGNVRINTLPTHAGADSDNIVVVDNDGVLKSVDRNSLNNNDEWQYDPATKRVNLKRTASADTKVFYNQHGSYINTGMLNETTSFFDYDTKTIKQANPIEYDKLANNLLLKKITPETYLPITNDGKYRFLTMNETNVIVEDTETDKDLLLRGANTLIGTSPTNVKNYYQLVGDRPVVSHQGTGDAKYIIANYSDGRIDRGKSTGYVLGGRFTASYATNESSNQQTGVYVFNQVLKTGEGRINKMADIVSHTSIVNGGPLTIKEAKSLELTRAVEPKYPLTITTAIGIDYQGIDVEKVNNLTLTNNYGLKIGNIKGASTNNYAIYTEKGKVSLGDELEVKSTIKVADNTTDTNCTPEKAGTIRFDATAKKFQGCTGTEWKDLHQ